MGYRSIASLAEGRGYADAIRSIEFAPMAGFFNPKSSLDEGLAAYFSGFAQILSYLYDPDGFFEGNLRRAGARNVICWDPRPQEGHAARWLCRPLERLALFPEEHAAKVFPSSGDREAANLLLRGVRRPYVVIHPGSGSISKNWPVENWISVARDLRERNFDVVVVGGEADVPRVKALAASGPFLSLLGIPLTELAAILAGARAFAGHDSGVSHIAAAAGAPCVLLFGPTDPSVWSPLNAGVTVLRREPLTSLPVDEVCTALARILNES